jgi:uncharacterized protein (DUF488 family)
VIGVNPFFSIGHSNRSIGEFVELLRGADIELVADIRTVPRSRANPQFNRETLPESLASCHVAYEHLAALGGLRGRVQTVSPAVNGFWTNDSFHNYADYALSAEFHTGLGHLVERGRTRRCVMMCSEALWWRCHRRIVADHLIARGETVLHIMGQGRLETARLTAGAVVRPDGTLTYPVCPPLTSSGV